MLVIRDAALADVPAVQDLLVDTWHATYDPIFGREKVSEVTDSWHSISRLTSQIGQPDSAFLVALVHNEIVATSQAIRDEGGAVKLGRLYVRPMRQGGGIGRALLQATLACFPDAGRVWLEVEPQNEPAIRFYERCGFARLDKITSCGGRSELKAIIMEKGLSAPATA